MVLKKKIQFKIYGIIGAILTLMVPFFLMFFNEVNSLEKAQSLCPLKLLSGVPCPSCGITKSMVYFYGGDVQKSLYYHIFGPLVTGFCIAVIAILTTEIITKKEYFNNLLFNKKLGYGLALFLAIYHFIRIVFFVQNNSIDDILWQSIWR